MTDFAPSIFIFVALSCEAKPLIQAWRLKKQAQKQPFAIYRNAETVVMVSGIGKVAMAGAVAYTMALFPEIVQPIMLNLGIAGHRRQAVGSCFLVDKITDVETQRRFYPQMVFDVSYPSLPLNTLSKADSSYADDSLCDMEASAFYEIAVKFSSSELIHCVKVVSDNAESPLEAVNEDAVMGWICTSLHSIENILTALTRLRSTLPSSNAAIYSRLLERFHFTATNAAKLQAMLNRWQVLNCDQTLNLCEIDAGNARELLAWLENLLEKKQYYL